MALNLNLRSIYESHWQSLVGYGTKIGDPIPANPMLLKFDELAFSRADKRIMICGQETWGWDSFGTSIDAGMNTYQRFFIERGFYPGYGRSAFWKAFRFFERSLSDTFQGQQIQFIYQNISKIGRNDDQTGVTTNIRNLEREHFPVFRKEVTLLQPDIILFLTGPDRDHDIRFHYPDATFNPAGDETNIRKCAWVSSSALPSLSLRLYHPSYFAAWSHQYKREAVSLVSSVGR